MRWEAVPVAAATSARRPRAPGSAPLAGVLGIVADILFGGSHDGRKPLLQAGDDVGWPTRRSASTPPHEEPGTGYLRQAVLDTGPPPGADALLRRVRAPRTERARPPRGQEEPLARSLSSPRPREGELLLYLFTKQDGQAGGRRPGLRAH
jgi:hypothetical protein